MRLIILLVLILSTSLQMNSQINRIRLSPLQKIELKVGLTDIALEYSRPSIKGRTIFGGLVPFDELWRTGANRNSKITFGDDVTIGDGSLKAGTYAIFTKPSKTSWDVYFYKTTTHWNVPEPFEMANVATMVRVTPKALNYPVESLSITIENLSESSASLDITWETTSISVPITLHTHKLMTNLMDEELERNAVDFHVAAAYLQERDIELPKAKKLMQKAIKLNDDQGVWDHLVMSWILDQMGDRENAIKYSKKSLKLAMEQEHEGGIKENTNNLKKWGVN